MDEREAEGSFFIGKRGKVGELINIPRHSVIRRDGTVSKKITSEGLSEVECLDTKGTIRIVSLSGTLRIQAECDSCYKVFR